jgi:thiol:disulfide interchange protein DsbA
MKRRVFTLLACLLPLAIQAQPDQFVAGTHYEVIQTPVRTADPNRIEVTEFFWYGCPACYQFEPVLENWAANLPEDVYFNRLHTRGGGIRDLHARIFYTALSLGEPGHIHKDVFSAIHEKGSRLTDEDEIAAIFADNGVSKQDFEATWNSFTVNTSLNRTMEQMENFGSALRSTPSIIVNGKYVIENQQNIFEIVSFLIEKER